VADSKKEGGFSGKWAIVTVHPKLPSRTEQIARARAWGVAESRLGDMDVSALVEDDVSKVERTTNWMGKLSNRADFIFRMKALQPVGDTVFFATPLCVGFSPKLAAQTIEGLWAAGMHVYVHSVKDNGSAIYLEGDDMAEFYGMIEKLANASYQSKHRFTASQSK
jgi:hypothetical protein